MILEKKRRDDSIVETTSDFSKTKNSKQPCILGRIHELGEKIANEWTIFRRIHPISSRDSRIRISKRQWKLHGTATLLRSNGFKGKKREKRKKKKREKKKTKKKKKEEETIDIWMDNGKYNFFTSAPTQNGITTELLLDFYFYIRLWTFNKAVFMRSGVKIRDEEEERRLTFFHMDVCCSIFKANSSEIRS